jgi:uncharacterized membrane protein
MNNVLNELLLGELLVILLAVVLLIIIWLTLSTVIRRASYSRQSVAAVMARVRLFWRRLI